MSDTKGKSGSSKSGGLHRNSRQLKAQLEKFEAGVAAFWGTLQIEGVQPSLQWVSTSSVTYDDGSDNKQTFTKPESTVRPLPVTTPIPPLKMPSKSSINSLDFHAVMCEAASHPVTRNPDTRPTKVKACKSKTPELKIPNMDSSRISSAPTTLVVPHTTAPASTNIDPTEQANTEPLLPLEIQRMIITYSFNAAWYAGPLLAADTAFRLASVSTSWCKEVFEALWELKWQYNYEVSRLRYGDEYRQPGGDEFLQNFRFMDGLRKMLENSAFKKHIIQDRDYQIMRKWAAKMDALRPPSPESPADAFKKCLKERRSKART